MVVSIKKLMKKNHTNYIKSLLQNESKELLREFLFKKNSKVI